MTYFAFFKAEILHMKLALLEMKNVDFFDVRGIERVKEEGEISMYFILVFGPGPILSMVHRFLLSTKELSTK